MRQVRYLFDKIAYTGCDQEKNGICLFFVFTGRFSKFKRTGWFYNSVSLRYFYIFSNFDIQVLVFRNLTVFFLNFNVQGGRRSWVFTRFWRFFLYFAIQASPKIRVPPIY